jgi:phosphate-selective porin OprO and OprP
MFRPVISLVSIFAAAPFVSAGTALVSGGKGKTAPAAVTSTDSSIFDRIWAVPTLYKSKEGFLNELRIVGRYQGQYHFNDNDAADSDFWDNRRLRTGLKATMLGGDMVFYSEYSWNDLPAQFDSEITEFWLEYKPVDRDGVNWRIGKFMPPFGHEFGISSRDIIMFERTAFVNQSGTFFTPGARLGYLAGKWTGSATAFSTRTDELLGGTGDGGWASMVTVGYDAKSDLGLDKADLRVDYLHSDPEEGDNRLQNFTNAVSFNTALKKGAWGLGTDVIYAELAKGGNAFHAMVMPTYDITSKLQFVSRFQVATSDAAEGLAGVRRYESFPSAPKGDLYTAALVGVNYYVYGQRFKIMNHLEFSNMETPKGDINNTTFYTGVRLWW